MSDWESEASGDQLQWRDTYFVWFAAKKRPALKKVADVLKALPERFELKYPEQDDAGKFESITLTAPRDQVTLEISYIAGEEMLEQALTLAEEIKENGETSSDRLARLASCDARFEIVQYETVNEDDEPEPGDDPDEMFDPGIVLIVLAALVKIVDGIGVDPQSGLLV